MTLQEVKRKQWAARPVLSALVVLSTALCAGPTAAQMKQDGGLWILANLQGEVAPRWALNLEFDVRSFDRFTRTSELIIQPGVFFNINDHWTWTFQYMYDARPPTNNEHRLLTDGSYHTDIKSFVLGTRLRFTVRFVDNVGTVLRLRHRLTTQWSISDTPAYLILSNEIFFNLNDQGAGPVLGFEEDRLYGASDITSAPISGRTWATCGVPGGAETAPR